MQKFQCLLSVLKWSCICYYIICTTVPWKFMTSHFFRMQHNFKDVWAVSIAQLLTKILRWDLNNIFFLKYLLYEKCLYSEFYYCLFSRIQAEYGDLLCKSSYSVRVWKNADQKNFKYRQFLRISCKMVRTSKYLKSFDIQANHLLKQFASLQLLYYTAYKILKGIQFDWINIFPYMDWIKGYTSYFGTSWKWKIEIFWRIQEV